MNKEYDYTFLETEMERIGRRWFLSRFVKPAFDIYAKHHGISENELIDYEMMVDDIIDTMNECLEIYKSDGDLYLIEDLFDTRARVYLEPAIEQA